MTGKSVIIRVGILLGMLFFITGCTEDKKQNNGVTIENNTKDEKQNNEQKTKGKIDLENYNLDYIQSTDFQNYFQWGSMAKAETGYYFWNGEKSQLVFFDLQSEQIVPVCNRPDCNHSNITCNANFSEDISREDRYSVTYLQYYEGMIYIIGLDGEDYVNLYKIAADGSTREKYMKLYKADLSGESEDITDFTQPEVCIHRGCLYFIDKKESMPSLKRMKLGTDKVETLYQTKKEHSEVYRMQAYGDYLFFQTVHYKDEERLKMEGGIYVYNIVTGDMELIINNAVSAYYVKDEQVYYSTTSGIQRYDLKTCKDERVIEGESEYPSDIYIDENSIYQYDWVDKLKQYDRNGKFITEYVLEYEEDTYMEFIYGDENYLFCKGKECIYTIEKGTNAKKEWTKRIVMY